jgi:hypothetical protein
LRDPRMRRESVWAMRFRTIARVMIYTTMMVRPGRRAKPPDSFAPRHSPRHSSPRRTGGTSDRRGEVTTTYCSPPASTTTASAASTRSSMGGDSVTDAHIDAQSAERRIKAGRRGRRADRRHSCCMLVIAATITSSTHRRSSSTSTATTTAATIGIVRFRGVGEGV